MYQLGVPNFAGGLGNSVHVLNWESCLHDGTNRVIGDGSYIFQGEQGSNSPDLDIFEDGVTDNRHA